MGIDLLNFQVAHESKLWKENELPDEEITELCNSAIDFAKDKLLIIS